MLFQPWGQLPGAILIGRSSGLGFRDPARLAD